MESEVFSVVTSPDFTAIEETKSKVTGTIDVDKLNKESREQKRIQANERREKLAEAWRQREIEKKGLCRSIFI